MKKLLLLKMLVVLCMITLSHTSKADWGTDSKNSKRCLSWRWKATSKVTNLSTGRVPEKQSNSKCNGEAEAYSRYGPQNGSHAAAQAWRSSSRKDGWAFTNVPTLLPGTDINALFQKNLITTSDKEGPEGVVGHNYGKQSIQSDMDWVFDDLSENSYTIKSTYLTGYMLLKNDAETDFYTTYDIIVWKDNLARNDESEDIEEEDIEWHSTITLSKEGVVGTGIFENESYYSVEETDSGTLLLINVLTCPP